MLVYLHKDATQIQQFFLKYKSKGKKIIPISLATKERGAPTSRRNAP